jgi:hypothetical protein
MAVSIARILYNSVLVTQSSVLVTQSSLLSPVICPYFAISEGSHRDKLGNATVSAKAMNVSHR